MQSWIYCSHYSCLRCHVIFLIYFINFLILSMLKTVVLPKVFVGHHDKKKIRILWLESSKEHNLFEIEIFCYIINVFTVTFHQFNASLLNKVLLLLLNIIDPKRLNSNVGLYMSVRIHRLQTTKLVWAYQIILACVFLKSYSTISA